MRRLRPAALLVLAAAWVAVAVAPEAAEGQYFGRNKVQYESFDFAVLETEHFDIYYYEAEAEAVEEVGRMAERWYARLSRMLDHDLRGRQPIVLYADHPDFEQTNAVPGQIGESTGGLTEFLKRRIVLPMGGSLAETDHVIGHELVHAFQYDLTGSGPNAVGRDVPVASRMPLWFIEGMAEYLSVGSTDPFKGQWMRGAVEAEDMPDWGDLGDPRYFPYHFGHSLWAYIGGRYGDDKVGRLLKAAAGAGNLRRAFSRVLGVPPDSLIAGWHEATREVQGPVLEATRPADSVARELVSEEKSGSQQNVGPSVSPNGELMVFASERSQFAIELFVADARTGEVVRKLTETTRDPHFESLQWLASSGAWSPDGQRFALAAVTRGQPVISVFDPRSGRKVREVRVPEVGEIFNPTWGPEGRRIAFSAQVGGYLDLYVLELESGELRRLTDDEYAELHPTWSPDGEHLAVATDRYSTDLQRLRPGQWRLALVDPETGSFRELPHLPSGKHINPQWSPDSEDLYFVSNYGGVANVYRLHLPDGSFHRVTDVQTGVGGITELSPSLSVAREAGSAVFSVHGEGNFKFDLYALGDRERLAGDPVGETAPLAGLQPELLPPADRAGAGGAVDRLLADADLGLPDPLTFERHDYESSLSLDFIGRPSLAVGASEFGVGVTGGGSAYFSDMLGNHNLATQLQVDGRQGQIFKSTAIYGQFVDQGGRWNWGVRGGQIPFIQRFRLPVQRGPDNSLVFRQVRFWQINREVTGLVEYPFNRSQRVEFSAGLRNLDFAARVREIGVGPGGRVLFEEDRDYAPLNQLSAINTGEASAALVFDNSVMGATAPMVGRRYRLEVSPTVGDLNYTTVIGDYRRYFLPVMPFTLAGRFLHVGRYGGGADDRRLSEYFLGFPSLVRGYDFGFGDFADCDLVAGTCPGFERLQGSRLGVFNAEARLPLLGGVGILPADDVPPVDLLTFFDAGVAWDGETDPSFLGGDREILRSVGVGARLNLFGLAVLELDYVNPLDRAGRDWHWIFAVKPGF